MIQVLVDADNVDAARVAALLRALPEAGVRMTVAGHEDALAAVDWPAHADVVAAAGWQRADLVLAASYELDDRPLVLVSGDGDFAQLVQRHGGPALVVSEAASHRLRPGVTVVDPLLDGTDAVARWLQAVL
ncbi:MAG TPA: hypothetical protein VNA12_04015 [Mycobacteriales bacterium]|nr:hypothetical protein [Mycobacteriales bacterium]